MSDLISRQAAIRWVKTECNPYGKPTLDFESGEKGYQTFRANAIRRAETRKRRKENRCRK